MIDRGWRPGNPKIGDEDKVTVAVLAQASRYGEQVRLLEDQGLDEDRAKVREAWVGFRNQLTGTELRPLARDAYYNAYCQ